MRKINIDSLKKYTLSKRCVGWRIEREREKKRKWERKDERKKEKGWKEGRENLRRGMTRHDHKSCCITYEEDAFRNTDAMNRRTRKCLQENEFSGRSGKLISRKIVKERRERERRKWRK